MILSIKLQQFIYYTMVAIIESLDKLIIQNILPTFSTNSFKGSTVTTDAEESLLEYNDFKNDHYISHAELLMSQLFSAFAAVEAAVMVVSSSYFNYSSTEFWIAHIAFAIYFLTGHCNNPFFPQGIRIRKTVLGVSSWNQRDDSFKEVGIEVLLWLRNVVMTKTILFNNQFDLSDK